MTRADLDPGFAGTGSKTFQNAPAPSGVAKKVLPHALSSHADAECSNAARGEAKKCRRNHAGRIGNCSRDLLDEGETFRYRFYRARGLMKILFVASEGLPYSKTGGLADVVQALPKALVEMGHQGCVLAPPSPGG